MPRKTEATLVTYQEWTFRLRPAMVNPGRLLVMLHGWTGDENSMWVFVRNLLPGYTILAPRAPFLAPQGGFSWRPVKPGDWTLPSVEDLRPAAESLLAFIDGWAAHYPLEVRVFDAAGFSQGAALAYTLALLFPSRLRSLAILSGFLPLGSETLLAAEHLMGKLFFVSHGTQDDLIPVERARSTVALLKEAGARVIYCEADIGHKVSAECVKGMESFYRTQYNTTESL